MPTRFEEAIAALKGPRVTVQQGFSNPEQTPNYQMEKYKQPAPSGESAIIQQQQAIVENNDGRLRNIIRDFGGVDVCARLFAAQYLALFDKMNSIVDDVIDRGFPSQS
jgi:hypothetical protein